MDSSNVKYCPNDLKHQSRSNAPSVTEITPRTKRGDGLRRKWGALARSGIDGSVREKLSMAKEIGCLQRSEIRGGDASASAYGNGDCKATERSREVRIVAMASQIVANHTKALLQNVTRRTQRSKKDRLAIHCFGGAGGFGGDKDRCTDTAAISKRVTLT